MNGEGVSADLLELDAPDAGTERRGWGTRQTLWLGLVVLAAAGAIVVALAWPQRQPEPDVVGLREAPRVAWTAPFDESTQLGSCGPGRILTGRAAQGMDLECVDLVDGRRVWTTTVDVVADEAWFVEVADTGFVELVAPSVVILLDRDTGTVEHRIDVSQDREAGSGTRLLSSDRGTLFWLRSADDADLSRLARPDPDSATWTVSLGSSELPGGGREDQIVEQHGYAWLPDGNSLLPSYALAVALNDGSVPEWARTLRTMAIQGNTVVGNTTVGLEARDIGSGRVLWNRELWTERAFAGPDAIFVTDRSMTDGVPTPDGNTTWPLSRIDPRTGAALWSVDLPHSVGKAMTFGDTILALDHEPEVTAGDPGTGDLVTGRLRVSAVDAATGSRRWTREIPHVGFSEARWGDGQVLIATAAGDGASEAEVLALDLRTGATRWTTSLASFPGVVGGRLITLTDGQLTVYH